MTTAPNDYPHDPQEAAEELRPQCALCAEYLPYEGARCSCELA